MPPAGGIVKLNLKIDDQIADVKVETEDADVKIRLSLPSVAYYLAMLTGRIPSKVKIPGSNINLVEFKEKASNG